MSVLIVSRMSGDVTAFRTALAERGDEFATGHHGDRGDLLAGRVLIDAVTGAGGR